LVLKAVKLAVDLDIGWRLDPCGSHGVSQLNSGGSTYLRDGMKRPAEDVFYVSHFLSPIYFLPT
jgi:hypothetical protein